MTSRTTVMKYKGLRSKSAPEIAAELGVDRIVEGTVLRSGDCVRISVQLIDASTDTHLWAESYERNLRDVLALQGEVARAVANEIQVKLTPQEQARLVHCRQVDPDAYEAYLKGRYYTFELLKASGEELAIFSKLLRRTLATPPPMQVWLTQFRDWVSTDT